VISDIVLLSCVGIQTVLVHGGGPEINTWLDKVRCFVASALVTGLTRSARRLCSRSASALLQSARNNILAGGHQARVQERAARH
jgi:hypothetical protein